MGKMCKFLYEERLKYKREKNKGMSQLCKLVMNAVSFGALIPKPAETKAVMKQEKHLYTYLRNNFHRVRRARKCGLSYEVELHQDDMDATLCKWGAMVLSYSKYLMDRLFACLGELGVKASYTDTDSVVFPTAALDPVGALFEWKYGLTFMGSQLLQFHSEFEMENILTGQEILTQEGKSIPTEHIAATRSYYLGKKLYFHFLEAEVGDECFVGCKFSAKGFTKAGIIATALKLYEGEEWMHPHERACYAIEELYARAARGDTIDVDLFPPESGKTRFVFDFGEGVKTPSDRFTRKFCITRGEIHPPLQPTVNDMIDELIDFNFDGSVKCY